RRRAGPQPAVAGPTGTALPPLGRSDAGGRVRRRDSPGILRSHGTGEHGRAVRGGVDRDSCGTRVAVGDGDCTMPVPRTDDVTLEELARLLNVWMEHGLAATTTTALSHWTRLT